MPYRMDGWEAAHRRLRSQHLSGPGLADPVAVVRHFGAMQAQEYPVAKWSVAQRTSGFDDAAVQRLIDGGAILRTHLLRPTWHFVAADDLGWMQALTADRVHVLNRYYYRQHGLDAEWFGRTNAVIAAALRGGNHLTRAELGGALAAAGLPATGNRLAYVIMAAELDGLVANGVMRGRQHTYALVAERVPDPVRLDPDAALAELTRRYLTSHGPATVQDFAWWSSLTVAQIRRGLELAGASLVPSEVDGGVYWSAPPGPARPDPAPTAQVLQGYDEYVIGYAGSRRLTNLAGLPVRVPDATGLHHPLVLDSQQVGSWRRSVDSGRIVARLTLATELTTAQRGAVEAAFARYADFAGVPVVLDWPARG